MSSYYISACSRTTVCSVMQHWPKLNQLHKAFVYSVNCSLCVLFPYAVQCWKIFFLSSINIIILLLLLLSNQFIRIVNVHVNVQALKTEYVTNRSILQLICNAFTRPQQRFVIVKRYTLLNEPFYIRILKYFLLLVYIFIKSVECVRVFVVFYTVCLVAYKKKF